MYKDKDSEGGKLIFGPVWDYNLAFGNANYRNGYKTNEFLAPNHIWWGRLLKDSILKYGLLTHQLKFFPQGCNN